MTEDIRMAMQECVSNPTAGIITLQVLMKMDGDRFVKDLLPLMRSDRDRPGYQRLMKLVARSDQIVSLLCDPECLGKDAAIEMAQHMVEFEPQLDTRLAHLLPGRDATVSNQAVYPIIERVLELLESVSTSARIVPALTHLMNDPNLRLRAKAALMIGRRLANTTFAQNCLRQEDARVRANAVESLLGGTEPCTAAVLRLAAKDTNNRVAGNALLGLYSLQERGTIGKILAMAADPRPLFRATAAWTMGQTSDPRFLAALEKLARDLYASVRKNALKSTERIRSSRSAAVLQVKILQLQDTADGHSRATVQALGPEGDPISGLLPGQFILWEGESMVTSYDVVEHVKTEGLAVGFALCPGIGIAAEVIKEAEDAVTGCLKLKNQDHRWAIAKFVSTVAPPDDDAPAANLVRSEPRVESTTFLQDALKLEKSLAEPPVGTEFGSAILAALRSLMPEAVNERGGRHLILLASGEFIPSAEIEEEADSAFSNKVAIHAVVVGSPHQNLKALCLRTGGIAMSVAGGTELAAAFRSLYLGLLQHYEIQFRSGRADRLEVYCPEGNGTCGIG